MNTKKLGNSDLMITPIGFGAWAVGGAWQFGWGEQSDRDSIAAIHRALELGTNWIDTAAVYGLGHSETVVAKALRDWKATRPYVFTKCGMVWNEKGEVGYSLRAESVRRECEASLRRLAADAIDLYQIHWPADDLAETVEGWTTMAELQKEGKVRWIGVSNFSVQELQKVQSHRACDIIATALLTDPSRRRKRTPAILPARKHWRHRLFANGVRSSHGRDDTRAGRQASR
jgi:aryl-alcohol dehydrogenase-like predicted oxidoreductase